MKKINTVTSPSEDQITLREALDVIKNSLIYDIMQKECSKVEFIRGQIFLINQLLTDKKIDKTVIIHTITNYFD